MVDEREGIVEWAAGCKTYNQPPVNSNNSWIVWLKGQQTIIHSIHFNQSNKIQLNFILFSFISWIHEWNGRNQNVL